MSNANSQSRRPSHRVYHVDGEGNQARWTNIGGAWVHDDNDGMNLSLDYLPTGTTGRLVIRKVKPKTGNQGGEA